MTLASLSHVRDHSSLKQADGCEFNGDRRTVPPGLPSYAEDQESMPASATPTDLQLNSEHSEPPAQGVTLIILLRIP